MENRASFNAPNSDFCDPTAAKSDEIEASQTISWRNISRISKFSFVVVFGVLGNVPNDIGSLRIDPRLVWIA